MILLLWLFSCLFFFQMIYGEAKQKAIDELNARQMILARQAKTGIENFFTNTLHFLNKIAELTDVIDLTDNGRQEIDLALKFNPDEITAITRVDETGKVVYTAPFSQELIGKDISYQEHIQEIMKHKKPVVSDVFTAVQGYRAVALHVPIVKQGEFKGTIGVLINFFALSQRFLEVIQIDKTGYAWMTSEKGIELFCPVPGHTGRSVFENCKDFPTIISMANGMVKGNRGVTTYEFDRIREKEIETVKKHAVYLPIRLADTFWSIVVATSEEELLASLVSFKNKLFFIFALLLGGSFFFSYYAMKSRGIVREQAHRKRVEEELQRIFSMSLDMICVADIQTATFLKVNPAFTEILGFSEQELLEKPFLDFIHPEDVEPTRVVVEQKLRAGAKVINFYNRYRCRDGSYRWLSWVSHPIPEKGVTYAVARDITEEKENEEALKKNKALLDATGRMARVGGWELETETLEVTWTDETYRIHELPPDHKPPLREAIDFFHPEDRPVLERAIERALEHGTPYDLEIRFITARGNHLWTRTTCRPEIIDGKTVRLVGTFQDITDRKNAEDALRKSEEKHRLLFESAGDAIFIHDAEGRMLAINPLACERLGYTHEALMSMTVDQVDTPEEARQAPDRIARLMAKGHLTFETFHLHKDGSLIPTEVSARLITWEGQPAMMSICRDITERKRAEVVLRNREQLLNEMGSLAKIGGWEHDLVKGKATWTKETYKIVGIESGPIPGPEEHLKYYPPKDRELLEKAYRHAMETGEQFDLELQGTTTKGRLLFVRAVGRPEFKDGKCVKMKGILQDITERKILENQLQQAQKMEAIGTLAGGIAHDFNNILGIILGNTELAMDDVPDWNPSRQNLDEIRKACLRAKDVVRQILSFSRKSESEQKPFNIASVVTESLKLLRASIPTSVDIRRNISYDINYILGDPTQINQIMINLCTNAAHAMEDEGGTLEVVLENIEIDEDTASRHPELNPGPYVHLRLTDTGDGIRPEILDRIFDPYFTTKDVGKGTGLGLSVVHGIVNSHYGKITVESETGKGTTFNIFFPAVERRVTSEPKEVQKLPTGQERILFVDDEGAMVNLNQQRLERLGYKVIPKTDPLEALEYFHTNPDQIDLVITDMTMPKMTGDRLAQEILKIRLDMPIILCTGYSNKISEEKAQEIGIRKYIEKPIEKVNLARSVREVLDGK